MKTILVTGADGFIGSHLVERLIENDYQVRALACYNSFSYAGWLEGISHKNLEIVFGDIRDQDICNLIAQDVDAICNLAALIGIPYSYTAPESYIQTNIIGTMNLCRAGIAAGVKDFIQTSTSEVYGSALYTPIDEMHPVQPQSPYSATKVSSDAIATSFYKTYGLPVKIIRPFNTFGPRQSARAVIPTIIVQALSGNIKINLGDTTTMRDFNYVENTCSGFLDLLRAKDCYGEVFNIGSGGVISIGAVLDLVSKELGIDLLATIDQDRIRPPNSEVRLLQSNNQKAKQMIGYEPGIAFEDGLAKTIEWFKKKENLSKYKTRYGV